MDIELKINAFLDSLGDSIKTLETLFAAKTKLTSSFLIFLAEVLKDPKQTLDFRACLEVFRGLVEEQERLMEVVEELECVSKGLREIADAVKLDPPL